MNIAYNMDCLKAMSEMPDKYYDLAVVDPPYGNALTNEVGGWHGKQKYYLGETPYIRSAEAVQHLSEQEGPGRRSTEKNHSVGCSTAGGVF
jgi:hypothetical protein